MVYMDPMGYSFRFLEVHAAWLPGFGCITVDCLEGKWIVYNVNPGLINHGCVIRGVPLQ